MDQERQPAEPDISSRATFLIPARYYDAYIMKSWIGKMGLKYSLHRLLSDPDLEQKVALLKPQRWRKHYQAEGQDLQRMNFYPDESDWAHLSILSNATGFSRCYIFVFLMLLNGGDFPWFNGGTRPWWRREPRNPITLCSIILDSRQRILTRVLRI
jgi:hypothetical protein